MNFALEQPALLLLALPAAAILVAFRDGRLVVDLVRALAVGALLVALAGPSWRRGTDGRDLVVVVDRSDSMPADGDAVAEELVRLALDTRPENGRLAVVSFAARPSLERRPDADGPFAGFRAVHDGGASDLDPALALALEVVPEDRPATVLVISDGEATGSDPLARARAARSRGIDVQVRPALRPAGGDLVAARMDLPSEVAALEPFQFAVWVHADEPRTARWRATADGSEFAQGERRFDAGWTRIALRDRPQNAGIATYRFELIGAGDPSPENDAVLGAVRVTGESRILVLNEAGHESALVAALRGGGFLVDATAPRERRLDLVALDAYDAIVLENVATGEVGPAASEAIARHVRDRGRSLLMTGGRASFARGGWWKSPLDPALPVDLDPRDEDRELSIALALVLDRSGSMSVNVGALTKMDLANDGSARAIELLGPADSVTLIAVDTSAHVILPLQPVGDRTALASRARRVQSQGGGIYVRTGLVAAVRELSRAPQANRHIVLFSDAADSEEPEGTLDIARDLVAAGGRLAVIALGTRSDKDATFLEELAKAGGSEAWFTQDAKDLPELFAQEVASMTRAGLSEEPVAVRALPALVELGTTADGLSAIGGHHLARARERTLVGLAVEDGRNSPLLVFGQRGLGRSAAYLGQVGGALGADLVAWDGFAPLFTSLARWMTSQAPPDDVHVRARVERGELVVEAELGPDAARRYGEARWSATIAHPSSTSSLVLERVAADRFRGALRLTERGIHLGALTMPDGSVVDLPPLAHSTSPEHLTAGDPTRGRRLLERLVESSLAPPFTSAADLWSGATGGSRRTRLDPWFALASLGLLVSEIAMRRLGLVGNRRRTTAAAAEPAPVATPHRSAPESPAPSEAAAASAPDGDARPAGSMLERVRAERARRRGGA